jgi:hypothetical protein
MLICELDDILFTSSRVQNLKENFNRLEEENQSICCTDDGDD